MLFITNFKTLYVKISYTLITLWSIFGLYLLQVRSALLKFLALISLSIFSRLLVNKGQIKNFIISTVVISLISIAIINVFDFEKFFPDIDFTQASSRILVLQDMDALKSQRISFDKALNIIFQKLDQNPIGLGPGRTGGAVSLAKSVIMKDPVYGIKSTWTFDNLFISLAIDLGWGMIFYLLIITIFPLFLIYKCIYFYFNKQEADITPILLSALTTVVLLAGNWGVIGIPYNPESFSFWFWTSIGITQIYKIENKSEDHV